MRDGVKAMKYSQTISTEKNKKELIFITICIVALIMSILLGVCLGATRIPVSDFFKALLDNDDSTNSRIIYAVRLPRVVASVLAGAALAVSGVEIQSILENPLAAPSIIGINSGAGFSAVLAMALFPNKFSLIPTAAFIGAMVTVGTVYIIARKKGASKITLVLAGIAVGNLLNAGINTITTFFPDALTASNSFKVGSVAGITFGKLTPAWIYIVVGIALAFVFSNELDILALGDKTAKSLGMNVKLIRFIMLITAAMLAGAAVSFSGLLSFVGLIVPHIVRFFVKSGSRRLITASAFLGGAFVTFCDLLSRLLFAPYEIQLGIVISYIGVPFFIYLIMKKKGGRHGDKA